MKRDRLRHCIVMMLAFLSLGLAACGSRPPPSSDVDYDQCRRGIGCTPQCTLKYGRSPYCDRD